MLRLEAALYRGVSAIAPQVREGPEQAAEYVGALLGREIALAARDIRADEVSLNICVSTMMDLPFATGWLRWPDIARAAAQHTHLPPRNFTASYECAGWGFALDYARRRCRPGSVVILTVMDLNLFDISFWRGNADWGRSGFGISTVVLRVPESGDFAIEARASQSSLHMGEFCVALRKWLSLSPSEWANAPFLPEGMVGIYSRFLPQARLLPDLHACYGHCFGSDTWISYITHFLSGRLRHGPVYTVTSASLRGYWAITDLQLAPDALLAFTNEDGVIGPQEDV